MADTDPIWLETPDLVALAGAGIDLAEWSPLGEQKLLLVRHRGELSPEELIRSGQWLRSLTCPVIGLADAEIDDPLSQALDVRLEDDRDVPQLISNINANPFAATTFVQLLRVTENMPLFDALQVESLAYATLQAGAEYASWLERHQAPEPFQPTDEGLAVVMTRDGNQVRLELNRPSNRNAMSMQMRDALNEKLGAVLADDSIESLFLSGRGKCFSTGGDLTEFGLAPDPATGHIVRSLSVPGRNLARCAERFGDKAVVHLHGACVGSGIEFPAFAGRITASEDAWFQLPEVGMGLIPGAGGCISIARRIGRQRTAWLGLSARRISAIRAYQWGLINEPKKI